jgi:hypothetical protein
MSKDTCLSDLKYNDKESEITDLNWEHAKLWHKIRDALYALPSSFKLDGNIPTIPATDLHAANTLLGAAIEDHIPTALNSLRAMWDDGAYGDCQFRRQPQTFPDVPFRQSASSGSRTLFGLESKVGIS